MSEIHRMARSPYPPSLVRDAVEASPGVETVRPTKEEEEQEADEIHLPQYHVILLDDDDHSYQYVIEMLVDLFGHNPQKAFKMACEVDATGRVIVETTNKERAELKRDQILSYGADWRIPGCQGSMSATVEPAE